MLVWIIYFKEAAQYNKSYIDVYMEEGKKLGIDVRLILVEDINFGVENGRLFLRVQGNDSCRPDAVIMRAIYPLLGKHMESMGLKVFNNSFVSEICNDKARTYQYLAGTGVRMVDSAFYRNGLIKDALTNINNGTHIKDALPCIRDRAVIKAVDGHGGQQVFLLDSDSTCEDNAKWGDDSIRHILEGIGSSDTVVQPFTGSRHQDLRVYVIGKEIIAAVLRTSKEGFRSNYSLGGEVSLYNLSDAEKEIVRRITDKFDFGLVGIDFIIGDDGELIFNEIEDVVGSRMLYRCSDINIARLYLKYIIQRIADNGV